MIVLLLMVAAISWHFSDAVLVPNHSSPAARVEVEAVNPGRIVLERSEDSERPGVYGLAWPGGHGVAGGIVAIGPDTVTRRLRDVHGYLVPEMEVGVEADVYVGDPRQALGLPFAAVRYPDELGPTPAWVVPGQTDTWAIVVHGINGTPQLGLRIVPTLHRAGLPAMLITYREDQGAPPSPDGFHHMGLTEWRDLQAAARYALAHGARRLVLAGYSMGGAIVAQFMQKSSLALPRRRRQGGADLTQRRLRRRAAPLGHLLPRARRWPRRGVERRPPTLRTPPDRIPLASAGLNQSGARARAARRSATARSTTEPARAPITRKSMRGWS